MSIRSGIVGLALAAAYGVQAQGMEFPDDPPASPSLSSSSQQPFGYGIGGFKPVQVNTNASGLNIANDAGNEPSLCIDPNNPKRIAIGWRQFDNKSSNFREAGNGYSTDGGKTWKNNTALTNGIFRSDPILEADHNSNFFYYSLKDTFLCDMFKSTNGGASYTGPVAAYGGDKAWMDIDRTNSVGRGHIYISWSTATGSRIFTRSTNGGTSFLNPITIPNSPVFGQVAVGANGEVYVVGIDQPSLPNSGFVFARSSNAKNAGQSPTFDLTKSLSMGGSLNGFTGNINPDGLLGQVNISCDTGGGTRNGWIYVLSSVDPSGSDPSDVRFIRSTDGGNTWSASKRINDDPTNGNKYQWFGTMSVAPNGRIDVVWNDTRNDTGNRRSQLFYSYSLNGGDTWSKNIALTVSWDPHVGWPNQNKIGDYYDMVSDNGGASLAFATTFNNEQDVYFLRIGLSTVQNAINIQP